MNDKTIDQTPLTRSQRFHGWLSRVVYKLLFWR